MDRRRIPAIQAHNRDLEEPSAVGSQDSLPRQIGATVTSEMDSPGFLREQSQHESGTLTLSSHSAQQPGLELSQERNAASRDDLQWQKHRDHHDPLLNSQFPDSMVIPGQIISGKMFPCWRSVSTDLKIGPRGPSLLDPGLFSPYEGFVPPLSIPEWEARPVNYPATCKFDSVCLELIWKLKPLNALGGNTFEFSSPKFPHVAALLNPTHHSSNFPLTAEIVSVI